MSVPQLGGDRNRFTHRGREIMKKFTALSLVAAFAAVAACGNDVDVDTDTATVPAVDTSMGMATPILDTTLRTDTTVVDTTRDTTKTPY